MSSLQCSEFAIALKLLCPQALAAPASKKAARRAPEPAAPRPVAPQLDYEQQLAAKRDFPGSFAKSYEPEAVEQVWEEFWQRGGFASPSAEDALAAPAERRFAIILPPPNVTGSLHIGHALTVAIQDAICRRKRMQGCHVVYVPGVDHAGIATQSVVEKMLAREGLTRQTLGKERFLERVWQWKEQYGSRIELQLRRLAPCLDWSRNSFTMDKPRSRAVVEAFVRLYDRGLIYRDRRLVNWDCRLRTAVSDIETEEVELKGPTALNVPGYEQPVRFGELVHFAYPFAEGPGEVVVATTRLETMLGDTAVAVHSGDARYAASIGRELRHPFIPDRHLRLIADDELVDPAFGTGAVKITPAHDPNDFECGQRHRLEFINLLNDDGTISAAGGEFAGLPRYAARTAVAQALERLGLLRGSSPNPMMLRVSTRSGDVIEPVIKPQWYVRCTEISQRMAEVVRSGELRLLPEAEQRKWQAWMVAPRDWCISRQLWWGHQIPAYRLRRPDGGEEWIVGRDAAEAEQRARERFPDAEVSLERDEDVLDTWFSSALLPFSNFNWPDCDGAELRAFFPNQLLETGNDILFFWVARMVMMSLLLTDQLPFKTVFLHAIVRDEQGEKMSKSRGNVIDPLELIDGCELQTLVDKLQDSTLPEREKNSAIAARRRLFPQGIPRCGADALRFALLTQVSDKDINLAMGEVVLMRKFCNKIWNSFYRVLTLLPADFEFRQEENAQSPADAWLRRKLHNCVAKLNREVEGYRFGAAVERLRRFWLNFCDNYLEYVKSPSAQSHNLLFHTLESFLRLLHPFMPFLSEELYQKLPAFAAKQPSICVAEYPAAEGPAPRGHELFSRLLRLIAAANRHNTAGTGCLLAAATADPRLAAFLQENAAFIVKMTRAKEFVVASQEAFPPRAVLCAVTPELALAVSSAEAPAQDVVFRLQREIKQLRALTAELEAKQANADYLQKARPEALAKAREKLAAYSADLLSKEASLKALLPQQPSA